MKKIYTVAVVALGLSYSMSGFGSHSFFDLLDASPKLELSKKSEKRECADFSGTWKGTCKVKEQTLEETVTIEQKNCDLLKVTGKEGKVINLPLGGVMNSTVTVPGNPGFTGSGSVTSHWNAEHNTVQVLVGKTGKKLAIDRPTRGMMVSQEMKLVEGKLAVDFTVYYHKEKTTGSCEFSKQ